MKSHNEEINLRNLIDLYRAKPKDSNMVEPYIPEAYTIYSFGLEIISKNNDILSDYGVSDEQISAMEKRLDIKLPSSYKEFLKITDGMLLPDFPFDILPLEDINWFYLLEPQWFVYKSENLSQLNDEIYKVSDDEYYDYGPKKSHRIRGEYLKSALQISNRENETVLILNQKVKFKDEWEAWVFFYYDYSANRFESFAAMLESILTED